MGRVARSFVFAGMTMAACASTGPAIGTPAPAAPAASPTSAAPSVAATVSGTVAYRERLALPADATLEVWIVDTSPGIGTMAILTQTTVAAQGRQVPLPFELQVDPSRVEQRRPYGLKAVIRAGGQMLFANTDPVPVLTLGHPSLVALTLARVPQEAAFADATTRHLGRALVEAAVAGARGPVLESRDINAWAARVRG